MSRAMKRLGSACARHPRAVIAGWVVALVGCGALVAALGAPTTDDISLPGSDAQRAGEIIERDFPDQRAGSSPVVYSADAGELTEPRRRRAIRRSAGRLRLDRLVASAPSPFSAPGRPYVGSDRTVVYSPVTLSVDTVDLSTDEAKRLLDVAGEGLGELGIRVSAAGTVGAIASQEEDRTSEVVGLGAAALLLLLAFGSLVASLLPIAVALFAVGIALMLLGLLGHLISVPTVGPTFATMIGLGVGIDYSLFIVTRFREELKAGRDPAAAASYSTATSGAAIVFAGATVILALAALLLAGIPIVGALGYSAVIAVAVAVAAATTLLPAVLSRVGSRVDSLRVPMPGRLHADSEAHGWRRWAERVAARPIPAVTVAVLVLVALALPTTNLELGQSDIAQLPDDNVERIAFDELARGFGPGFSSPIVIAIELDRPARPDRRAAARLEDKLAAAGAAAAAGASDGDGAQDGAARAAPPQLEQRLEFLRSRASDRRLTRLDRRLGDLGGVASVSPAQVSDDGSAALISIVSASDPASEQTAALVDRLSDDVLPDFAERRGTTAAVGGQTAGGVELADRISAKLPWLIAVVIAVSFVLLVLAFRSIVVPLLAAVMNLLSVGAAYGVVTAVFQEGVGISLVGVDAAGPVVSFVPLLMFAILFGLSMDYQVFLLTRIHELHEHGAPNRKAVIEGLASSARVITSAALIMVAVFGSFILEDEPSIKQFGLGLAVAIALDAVVIRTLLVPAVMVMLGERNWWLPESLARRLPRLGLGE